MLHNSGHYDPNEAPINMGTSINSPQLTSVNMPPNLSNISKNTQGNPDNALPTYQIPNYAPYNQAHTSLSSQYYPYSGFHSSQGSKYPNFPSNSGLNLPHNGMHPYEMPPLSSLNANYTNIFPNNTINSHFEDQTEPEALPSNILLRTLQTQTKASKKLYVEPPEYDSNVLTQDSQLEQRSRAKNVELTPDSKALKKLAQKTNIDKVIKIIESRTYCTTTQKQAEATKAEKISKTNESSDFQAKTIPKPKQESNNQQNQSKQLKNKVLKPENMKNEHSLIGNLVKTDDNTDKYDDNDHYTNDTESKVDLDCMNPFIKDSSSVNVDISSCNVLNPITSLATALQAVKGDLKLDPTVCYICGHCKLIFAHPKRFLIHFKWHTFGSVVEERQKLAQAKEIQKARRRGQIFENDDRVGIPCEHCEKVFKSKKSLRNHKAKEHRTEQMKECKICQATVKNWKALRDHHQQEHASDVGYKCDLCDRAFKFRHSLVNHKATHNEKTVPCPQCGKKFGSEELVKRHMKIHDVIEQGPNFHCNICGKAFYYNYNLQEHERSHTQEKPYRCDICGSAFCSNSSLKRHMRVSHSSLKPYECSTCHRQFATENIKNRHEMREHGDEKEYPYSCTECESKYLQAKELKRHIYKMHPKGRKRRKSCDVSE